MKFIGRRHELRLLEGHFRSAGSSLLPIYGRRRVGKSRLIDEFTRGKPCIYFLGKKTTPELQIDEFRDAAQRLLGDGALAHARFRNWQDALQTVTRNWRREEKLVLVLDELQWIAESSPEIVSILQALWDQEWRKRRDLLIILCGSHVGFMEREILGERSPLFGRRSDQIRLGPLPFQDATQLVSHYGEADRAGVYFVVGGIPAYLERFSPGRSLSQALTEEFCSELQFFALEPHFLIREELRDPSRYFSILTLLARGRLRQRDLAERSHIEPRVLATYLNTLQELGYVTKTHPVVPGKINAHQVHYEVSDPLLCFWFRFIFPNLQLCRPGHEQAAFDQCIRPHLDAYFGGRFEKLCQEQMARHYQSARIPWQHIGQYWERDFQIDVAAVRRDNWIDLGECRWGAVRSLPALVTELGEKVRRYPNGKGWSVGQHLFLRHKRPANVRGVQVHILADFFSGPHA